MRLVAFVFAACASSAAPAPPWRAGKPEAIGSLKARACPASALPAAALPRCAASHYGRVYADGARIASMRAVLAEAGLNATFRPTVLIVGAGHAGTSSVAAEVLKLGYRQLTHTPGFERHFTGKHEDGFVVHADEFFLKRTHADKVNVNANAPADACGAFAAATYALGRCLVTDHAQLRRRWRTYPRPAVLKDPRFVWTAHLWADVFADEPPPILLHVRRDQAAIRRSHEARGETSPKNLNMSLVDAVASRAHWADWQRANWCGPTASFNVASLQQTSHANHFAEPKKGKSHKRT